MPKISDAKRDARRRQILDAALACFSEAGFHQTGMADIVRRSGLSRGAVYLYFSSKDDIIEALAVDRHRNEAALNATALANADPMDA
jgi:AcrR family transcriptional regulator